MNRYQGNTGRVTRVPDPAAQHRPAQRPAQTAPPPRQPAPAPVQKTPPMGTGGGPAPAPVQKTPPMGTGGGLDK